MSEQCDDETDQDECSICGTPSSETSLGRSEERDALVCLECVGHLQEKGHYPDEDGPAKETTTTYQVSP